MADSRYALVNEYGRQYKKTADNTYYDPETPDAVISVMQTARWNNRRVRLFIGDLKTGECWGDEFDVIGTIGRSMGPCHIPILIHNRRSMGGGGILTGCILRIVDVASGKDLYRAGNYRLPEYRIVPFPYDRPPRWRHGAAATVEYVEGAEERKGDNWELTAAFRKTGQAERWIQFMRGERFSK